METKHCGEVANKISLFKRLIREKGEKSGRREKQPKKLGRREKNGEKNRGKRNLTVRSSPLIKGKESLFVCIACWNLHLPRTQSSC